MTGKEKFERLFYETMKESTELEEAERAAIPFARNLRGMYHALNKEGFSEEQAFDIVCCMITGVLRL